MLKKNYAFVKKTETDVCSYDKVVICSFVWVFVIARATLPLLRRHYEGLIPSGLPVKGVRNDNIEYRCGRFSLSFRAVYYRSLYSVIPRKGGKP